MQQVTTSGQNFDDKNSIFMLDFLRARKVLTGVMFALDRCFPVEGING